MEKSIPYMFSRWVDHAATPKMIIVMGIAIIVRTFSLVAVLLTKTRN